jgi:hypothetical protein
MPRRDALAVATLWARDSMPPLRLDLLADVATHPDSPRRCGPGRSGVATTVSKRLAGVGADMLHAVGVDSWDRPAPGAQHGDGAQPAAGRSLVGGGTIVAWCWVVRCSMPSECAPGG